MFEEMQNLYITLVHAIRKVRLATLNRRASCIVNYSCVDVESEKDEERCQDEQLHLCRRDDANKMKSRIYLLKLSAIDKGVITVVLVAWR
jgi:hypothetical protein